MRTNLFKSLLVATMAVGAMGGVNAEETTSVIYSQDFDSETSIPEGWTQASGTLELATNGTNKYLVEKTAGSGSRLAWYKGNVFSNSITDKSNWTVEFDCQIAEGTNTGNYSQGVWLLGKDLTSKWGTPSKPIVGICKTNSSNGKYILNVNATNTEHTIDLKSGTYYHYKVTYDKGTKTLKFAIFSQDEKTVVFEETSFEYDYTTSSMGDFASIAIQAGRNKRTSSTTGYTCLDNIKVSTVSSEEIVTNPTAKITSVNGTDRTITLSSDNSSYKLFYYLDDNSSDPTQYTAPFVVSKSSTVSYYAQSTSGTKSQIQALDVVCENIVLNSPTFEKKSYNDGVSSVALYTDQSDKECTPVAKIHYELSNGTSGTVNNADVINVADGLILYIYSEAEGYTKSSTVSVYAQSMSGKVEFSETYNGRVSANAGLTISTEPVTTISKTDFYSIYNGEQLLSDKLLAASKTDNFFMLRADGLYNGTGRTFAIQNLKAGQYIILKGVRGNADFSVTSPSNMTLNSWNTINGNTYAFIVNEDGNVTFNIPRYGYFQSISIISPTETVSVSEAGFATYATTKSVVVPEDENVKVMTVKVNAEGTAIELNEVKAGTVIPGNTGFLVKATAGNHDFVVTSDKGTELAYNDLKAATEDVNSDGVAFFALTKLSDGKVGFALVANGVVIPAGKAYLKVPGKTAAKFFGLDGEATGINSVKTAKADGAYYTLEGVKTTKPVKGLYIHNGKKIVVK